MFKSYLLTTFRSVKNNLGFTIVNVIGLSVGIAAFILITVFVRDELTFDKFHKNHDRIYRGLSLHDQGFITGISDRLIDITKENMPEVEEVTLLSFAGRLVMDYNGEKVFENEFYRTNADLFKVFDFSLKYGDESDALRSNNSVVISKYIARKYYGKEDVVGEIFKMSNSDEPRIITGVLNDIEGNSSFRFNVLIPFEKDASGQRVANVSGFAYFLLNGPVDEDEFSTKLMTIASQNGVETKGAKVLIENFGEIYLNSDWAFSGSSVSGNKRFITIFSIIGIMLLVLACINYINSSTAKSLTRLKEVGVRKVVGASKKNVQWQFLMETGFFVSLAVVIGAGMAEYFLPRVNDLADKSMNLDYFTDYFILTFLVLLIPVVTFLAGIYPAFFISKFKTLKILKGNVVGGKSSVRKYLVIVQLVTTLTLLFGTQVISNQINFFMDAEVGMDAEGVILFNLPRDESYEVAKDIISSVPGVEQVTASWFPGSFSTESPLKWMDRNEEKEMNVYTMPSAMNVVSTLGINIVKGRDFVTGSKEDEQSSVLIGESVANALGFENPIGEQIKVYNDEFRLTNRTIIGVFKDLHFNLKGNPRKRVIVPSSRFLNAVNVRLDKSNQAETILRLKDAWMQIEPETPLQYRFMQDRIEGNYNREVRFGTIIQYFSLIAMLIAALGLFGLSIFTIVSKYKEIGIRKVLGASVWGIVINLLRSYFTLVLLASLVAIPLAYYIMDMWLSDFVNRIQVGGSVFATGIGISLFIVVITVGYQSVKAAMSNPVTILRDE